MTTAFITHTACLMHDMGTSHPECSARLRAIDDQLIASGLSNYLLHAEAPLAQQLKVVADKYARGRIVSMLEGGYELHARGRSVASYLKALSR